MNDHKWIQFIKKHSRRIIAFFICLALLLSLSNIGTIAALVRETFQKTSGDSTDPSATTAPSESTEPLSREEEMELAVTYLTESIQKDPTDPELFTQRAALYYNLGQTESALADYSSALALKDDPQTRYLRAIVYTTSGDSNTAYLDLSAALKAEPENREYLSLMADTCNSLQRYEQALECLEKLLADDPENCILHTLAGDACVYLNDFEGAAPHYEKAISFYTDDAKESGISKASLFSAYGNTLKMMNRFAEAAKAYDLSLQLEENKELYFQRGFCLLQSENYTDATADFTKCIALEYEVTYSHFQRALCYYATGSFSDAIADFKVYEEAFPEKTDSFLYMGLCYQNTDDYYTAIDYYKKCIEEDISPANCYFNLGNCYYNLWDYYSAINNYTSAMDEGSYVYESLLNRGICYIQLNKYNEAKADLKRVIDECPDYDLVASASKSYEPIKNITIITKG